MRHVTQQPSRGHGRLLTRTWLLPVLAVILIPGHGIVLYYASSHLALSTTIASGLMLLVVIRHLGGLGPLYALLRRRFRR
jgi:hypothetical protein